MGIVEATVISALVGAGSTIYATQKQKEIAEEEANRMKRAEEAARREAERIARETSPEAEELKSIKFGTDNGGDVGSTNDFEITKKKNSSLGISSSSSILGFNT